MSWRTFLEGGRYGQRELSFDRAHKGEKQSAILADYVIIEYNVGRRKIYSSPWDAYRRRKDEYKYEKKRIVLDRIYSVGVRNRMGRREPTPRFTSIWKSCFATTWMDSVKSRLFFCHVSVSPEFFSISSNLNHAISCHHCHAKDSEWNGRSFYGEVIGSDRVGKHVKLLLWIFLYSPTIWTETLCCTLTVEMNMSSTFIDRQARRCNGSLIFLGVNRSWIPFSQCQTVCRNAGEEIVSFDKKNIKQQH